MCAIDIVISLDCDLSTKKWASNRVEDRKFASIAGLVGRVTNVWNSACLLDLTSAEDHLAEFSSLLGLIIRKR